MFRVDGLFKPITKPITGEIPTVTNLSKEQENVHYAQKHDLEVWVRVSPGIEFIKLVIWEGKLVGALLIGDTDLEEVMENLILNRLDVLRFGIDILDPSINIEDFFD